MENLSFIISQILVVFAYGLNVLTFFTKARGKLLFISSTMSVFNAVSLALLNAWAGVFCQMLGIVRNVIFNFTQKTEKKNYSKADYAWLTVFLIANIVGGVLTFDKWFSIMPIISSMVYTYAVWQKNVSWFKYFVFYSSVTMIIYYIFIWSPFALVLETISFIAIVVSIVKQVVKLKKDKLKNIDENKTATQNEVCNAWQTDKNQSNKSENK